MVKMAWTPRFCLALPEGHRFPMAKYNLIPERLILEGSLKDDQLFQPPDAQTSWFRLSHDMDYLDRLLNVQIEPAMVRKIGFPLSPDLIDREFEIAMGTWQCCLYAKNDGIAFNAAGGTHHAFRNGGEGFCILNDLAFAAHMALETKLAEKVFIIDLDVHQGNGTAAICAENDSILTFSMHGQNNYPLRKENSSFDLGLPDRTGDQAYLHLLQFHLPRLLDFFEPDLILYQAGVDVLETDRLGRLSLSAEGCRKRDAFVFNICKERNLPVVVTLGGGYSPDLEDIVEAHCQTIRQGLHICS
jgi:acetoin utilization deacetylase AcuC-like enzyme